MENNHQQATPSTKPDNPPTVGHDTEQTSAELPHVDQINQKEEITEVYNQWQDPVGNHEKFTFDAEHTGITPEIAAALIDGTPSDFFSLFFDDEVLQMMTDHTNLYATQKLINQDNVSEGSRLRAWVPTTKEEMKLFIGIVGYMGLVKSPRLKSYWHKPKKMCCSPSYEPKSF